MVNGDNFSSITVQLSKGEEIDAVGAMANAC